MKMNKLRIAMFIMAHILMIYLSYECFYIFGLFGKIIYYTDKASIISSIVDKIGMTQESLTPLLDMSSSTLIISLILFMIFLEVPALIIGTLIISRLAFIKDKSIIIKEINLYSKLLFIALTVLLILSVTVAHSATVLVLLVLLYTLLYYLIWDRFFIKRINKVCTIY